MYKTLLSAARQRPSTILGRTIDEEAESDRGRVLFCAPFRRLQSKAQVFSLEKNASVRTRLTHSLEVATIGRQLAQAAFNKLHDAGRLEAMGLADKSRAFVTFVDTACLIHDLGNPPFGHFGEDAIKSWFSLNKASLQPLERLEGDPAKLWNTHLDDFLGFDGNPQGLRIVSRLQANAVGERYGLNLTATTIAAIVKYPFICRDKPVGVKKHGCFSTERDTIEWARSELKLGKGVRHPLVTLMEAADDMAYGFSDIEDGIEKGVTTLDAFFSHVARAMRRFEKHPTFSVLYDELAPFWLDRGELSTGGSRDVRKRIWLNQIAEMRNIVTRHLAGYVGKRFADQHEQIIHGSLEPLLLEEGDDCIIDVFKSFARAHLYRSKHVLQREILAHRVITGLLDQYREVMRCRETRFESMLAGHSMCSESVSITVERSLVSRLPRKHIESYNTEKAFYKKVHGDGVLYSVVERVLRIQLIVDYISGMTDDFALRTYRLFSGIDGEGED